MFGEEPMDGLKIDILKEIGSIGTGNAVTALSKMLGKQVKMNVPTVNLLDFKDVSVILGGAEDLIFGILVQLSGDINGMIMFLLKLDSARILINSFMGRDMAGTEEFTDLDFSALQEIGNILSSSYLSALSTLINKKIFPSVPFLAQDMAGAILSVPAIEFGKIADKVLFIESVFSGNTENISGYFVMVPDLDSFEIILKSLGVM